MKKLIIFMLVLTLCGCAAAPALTATVPETTVPETTVPVTTVPETTVPPTTVPPTESILAGYDADEVWTYFEEVVLHVEYGGDGGDYPVHKWLSPIRCSIFGDPTEEDLQVLEAFFAELNEVPGFPGIGFSAEDEVFNLSLSFLGPEEFTEQFSDVVQGEDAVGATEFWYYTDTCEIYDARIGYRTDLEQSERNSILLEEIVNTLGISDTELREDSIVYQYSNDNLSLSHMDWLLLELLYHPSIRPNMSAEESRTAIEALCG